VATPLLLDANFHRTVILMLEHHQAGALGVVLNRPSQMGVDEPLPQWDRYAAPPPVLFVGGPVHPSHVICLARLAKPVDEDTWTRVLDEVGILDLGKDPDAVPVDRLRMFAGYAGWAGGQLEGELAEGAWWVVEAAADDALCDEPEGLWQAVLRRQRGLLRLFARYPPDPSVN
jgi:putative transcriptional regulator